MKRRLMISGLLNDHSIRDGCAAVEQQKRKCPYSKLLKSTSEEEEAN